MYRIIKVKLTQHFFLGWILFLLIVLSTGVSVLHAQKTPESASTRFVLAAGGLKLRESASQNGKLIQLIPYGESVNLIDTTSEALTIDGFSGHWAEVDYKGKKGFLFDGFLIRMKAPLKGETLQKYATRNFKPMGPEVKKSSEGITDVNRKYEGGVLFHSSETEMSSEIELTIPGISMQEGFLLIRSIMGQPFLSDSYPQISQLSRQKWEKMNLEVSVSVEKDSKGNVKEIRIVKGDGVSMGFHVMLQNDGSVTISSSSAD
jgi:hypothetical protein